MRQQELYEIIKVLPTRPDVVTAHLMDILSHKDARRVVNAPVTATNATVKTPFDAFLIEACLLGHLDQEKRKVLLTHFLAAGADARRGKKAVRDFVDMMGTFGYNTLQGTARDLLKVLDLYTSVRFDPVVRARYFNSTDNLDLQQMLTGTQEEPRLQRSYTA